MVNQQGSPFYKEDAFAMAAQSQAHSEHIPGRQNLSGAYTELRGGLLAVRLREQEISSGRRPEA